MKNQDKTTERPSAYDRLEAMPVTALLKHMNDEDQTVAARVRRAVPAVARLVAEVVKRMERGGRLFYVGAGTSGRLGIVDASECPPTYGIAHGRVVGLIAGGDKAIRKAVEFAEDDPDGGWKDLRKHRVGPDDFVIGIAASGATPYVVGALRHCRRHRIATGCITCNRRTPLARQADFPVEVVVGPEFVTGSTRMKAGTAQKLVLNMISTAVMIRLGRVEGNRMVDMQLTNNKLVDRGTRMVMKSLGVSRPQAARLLKKFGGVRKAVAAGKKKSR